MTEVTNVETDMGIPIEQLEGMSDRELDCLLARILCDGNRYEKRERWNVEGDNLYSRVTGADGEPLYGRPVPYFTTTWEGFGEAMDEIHLMDYTIELRQHGAGAPAHVRRRCL